PVATLVKPSTPYSPASPSLSKKLHPSAAPRNGFTRKKAAKPNSPKSKASLSPCSPLPPTNSKPSAKMIPANFASSISGPLGALPAFRKCPKFKPCSACTAIVRLKSPPSASTTPMKNPPHLPLSPDSTPLAAISFSVPPISTPSSPPSIPTGTPPYPTPCLSSPTVKSSTKIRVPSTRSNSAASSSPISPMTITSATKPTGNLNRPPNPTNILFKGPALLDPLSARSLNLAGLRLTSARLNLRVPHPSRSLRRVGSYDRRPAFLLFRLSSFLHVALTFMSASSTFIHSAELRAKLLLSGAAAGAAAENLEEFPS